MRALSLALILTAAGACSTGLPGEPHPRPHPVPSCGPTCAADTIPADTIPQGAPHA